MLSGSQEGLKRLSVKAPPFHLGLPTQTTEAPKKLNTGYAFPGHYDLFLYSDRHTMDDYKLEPLFEFLCEENRVPVSYHYVYIDTDGKLACFDLAHGAYEVRSTAGIREKLLANPDM